MKTLLTAFLLCVFMSLSAQEMLFAAKEKGKLFGYIDETGNYRIQPMFDSGGPFYKGTAVVSKDKKFGVINTEGKYVVQPVYDNAIEYAPEGYITVLKGGKWGLIDQQGNTILPFKFPYLSVMKEDYIIGGEIITRKQLKSQAGRLCPIILNIKGDTIRMEGECPGISLSVPGYFSKKGDYSEGGWPMVQEGKILLEDIGEGSLVILDLQTLNSITLDEVQVPDRYYRFREGAMTAMYRTEGDSTGAFVLDKKSLNPGSTGIKNSFEIEAYRVHPFFNGVAAAERNGKWFFIDRKGDVISETNLPTTEFHASPPMYFNGLIGFFNSKDKVGFVNLNGETMIPFDFDEYHPFEWDVTPVKYRGSYGLLKKDGTWAVPPKFAEIYGAPCPCYQ